MIFRKIQTFAYLIYYLWLIFYLLNLVLLLELLYLDHSYINFIFVDHLPNFYLHLRSTKSDLKLTKLKELKGAVLVFPQLPCNNISILGH